MWTCTKNSFKYVSPGKHKKILINGFSSNRNPAPDFEKRNDGNNIG